MDKREIFLLAPGIVADPVEQHLTQLEGKASGARADPAYKSVIAAADDAGITHIRYDGKMSATQREDAINEFQSGKGAPQVMFLSLACGRYSGL